MVKADDHAVRPTSSGHSACYVRAFSLKDGPVFAENEDLERHDCRGYADPQPPREPRMATPHAAPYTSSSRREHMMLPERCAPTCFGMMRRANKRQGRQTRRGG